MRFSTQLLILKSIKNEFTNNIVLTSDKATSMVTSMAQNPKKGLETVFFQVRATNKMNEKNLAP